MTVLARLQQQADDLFERMFIIEHELKSARTIDRRVEAAEDAAAVVGRIDRLRQDADDMVSSSRVKKALLDPLDKRATRLLHGEPYRIACWFAANTDHLSWLVGPESIEPLLESQLN